MRLQEFFDTQKNTIIADIDKLDLYQDILYKKNKKNSLKRASFVHAKYLVYSAFSFIFLIGVYGVYLFNGSTTSDRFFAKNTTQNTANADYIARVLNVKGNFSVEHKWVLLETNNIWNGDSIILKAWAQMVFQINSWAESTIVWPAKLVIQQTSDGNYKLNLVYGNFIQMEGKETLQQTIELSVNDIVVKQQDKSKPVNFSFLTNHGQQILKNNGANLMITQNNKWWQRMLSNKQILSIQNNDITLFDNRDKFNKAVQNKNVSQTFSLLSTQETKIVQSWETTSDTNLDIDLLSLLNNESDTTSNNTQTTDNQEITSNIVSLVSDEKKILTPDQNDKLRSNLSEWSFIISELQEVYTNLSLGNTAWANTSYNKLENRIKQLYISFGLKYAKTDGATPQKLNGLKQSINVLITSCTAYSIPPKYTNNLQTMNTWINMVANANIQTVTTQDEATIARQTLAKNWPKFQ